MIKVFQIRKGHRKLFKCSNCKTQYFDEWFLDTETGNTICPICFAQNSLEVIK